MASPVGDLVRQVRRGFLPAPALRCSEFADENIVVTNGPLQGTRWRTAFAPYQRGIMDVFHEPGVTTAVVMGSSQWGKTAVAVNIVAYHIAYDPCQVLVVEPTVDPMAKDFARNRLDPIIKASPALSTRVGGRQRGRASTVLQKTYDGGALSIGGANSASSLASRPVRLLVLDEVDRYPAELPGEGSTLAIAMKRTTAYKRRKRILMLSSPTLKTAPIHVWFERGDQRRFFVPCPACDHMHVYEWQNVRWERDDPRSARLHCPKCDHAIDDAARVLALQRGEWRATNLVTDEETGEVRDGREDPSVVSFHLWEAYSPLSSLSEIVASFLRARAEQKKGDEAEMHTWQNTTLGEPIEIDAGEGVEGHVLLLRREPVDDQVLVPEGAACLTAGVDVQDDRLEVLVTAWGPGEECWVLDRHTLPGDPDKEEPWRALDALLELPYDHRLGPRLMVHSVCIDSAGHKTTAVYRYASRHEGRRVYAIIGRDGQRPLVSSPSRKRWGRSAREVNLYTVGVDAAKSLLMSRLGLIEPGPGYVHLPHVAWCDDEFVAQLTAERLKTKWTKGRPQQSWVKIRARNEALDTWVYSLAALRLLNPRLGPMLEELRRLGGPTTPAPSTPSIAPAGFRRRIISSSYLKG